MNNESPLSQVVVESYPFLMDSSVEFIKRLAPQVPESPDRFYDVYKDTVNNRLFTHVTTDHPDPLHDGREFQDISRDEFRFKNIISPNMTDGRIEIVENDAYSEEFFVKEGDVYHYVASVDDISQK